MSKLPALQFYPGDWRKDPAVQSLTFHDRGVWFELLLLMHESPERGKLMLKRGTSMPEGALARLLGLDKQNLTKTLTTLLEYGVAEREATGALVSRRMVREEEIRKVRQKSGKKGGNPILLNQRHKHRPKHRPNQNAPPMDKQKSNQNRGAAVAKKKKVPSSPLDGFPPDPSSLIPLLSPKKKKVPPEAPPKSGAGRALTVAQRQRMRIAENSPLMVTIGSWFRRKPTTKWTLQESEALEQVNPSESEIELMAKYYTASMSPKDNIRRRDVGTLLNNWPGELDRARDFNSGTFFRDNGRANSEVLKELRERLKEAKKDIAGMTQDGRYVPTEEDEWLRLKELRKDRRELKQQIDKIMDAFKGSGTVSILQQDK